MTAKKPKFINIVLLKMSQGVVDLKLNAGATVQDALVEGGYGDESLNSLLESVRVNGKPVELNDKLKDGDTVTVAQQVKGGIC